MEALLAVLFIVAIILLVIFMLPNKREACHLPGLNSEGAIVTKKDPGQKPNIIFVNVDDLGWKDVHFMQGYDHYGKATDKYKD